MSGVDSEQDCFRMLRPGEKAVEVERDDAGLGNLVEHRQYSLDCYNHFDTHIGL